MQQTIKLQLENKCTVLQIHDVNPWLEMFRQEELSMFFLSLINGRFLGAEEMANLFKVSLTIQRILKQFYYYVPMVVVNICRVSYLPEIKVTTQILNFTPHNKDFSALFATEFTQLPQLCCNKTISRITYFDGKEDEIGNLQDFLNQHRI